MAIIVTCPGCRKSFSVSEKFAGQTGPCPKCKTKIRIPKAENAVKVHGGEAFSANAGQMVLKPIKRREWKVDPVMWVVVIIGTLATYAITFLLGTVLNKSTIFTAISLVVITPPLVYLPYIFLRNAEEIEGLSIRELVLRTALCTAAYVLLWGGFIFFSKNVVPAFGGDLLVWLVMSVPFLIVGALFGSVCYNLEWGDGVVHMVFYIIITLSLCYVGGIDFVSSAQNASYSASGSGEKVPPPPPPGG